MTTTLRTTLFLLIAATMVTGPALANGRGGGSFKGGGASKGGSSFKGGNFSKNGGGAMKNFSQGSFSGKALGNNFHKGGVVQKHTNVQQLHKPLTNHHGQKLQNFGTKHHAQKLHGHGHQGQFGKNKHWGSVIGGKLYSSNGNGGGGGNGGGNGGGGGNSGHHHHFKKWWAPLAYGALYKSYPYYPYYGHHGHYGNYWGGKYWGAPGYFGSYYRGYNPLWVSSPGLGGAGFNSTTFVNSSQAAPVQAAPVQTAPVQTIPVQQVSITSGPVITAVEPMATDNQPVLMIRGERFGSQPGQLILDLGNAQIAMKVLEWNGTAVQAEIPMVQVADGTSPSLVLIDSEGTASQPFDPAQ